jgi:hypothetical protein
VSEGDDAAEPEESSPLRRALDLFVFAPVGVALTVAEDLPSLIAKGRQRVETEIRNARVVGEFVVTRGQKDLTGRVGQFLNRQAAEPSATTAGDDGVEGAADATDTGDGPGTNGTSSAPPPIGATAPIGPTKPAPDPADGILVEQALAGYDTLSASQVVRRLESLDPEDLRALYRHEASHRNRRTILNRTTQLLEGAGSAGSQDGRHSGDSAAPSEADHPAP